MARVRPTLRRYFGVGVGVEAGAIYNARAPARDITVVLYDKQDLLP